MERKRFFNTLWVMVTLVSLLLAACQPAATPTQPPAPAATEPPAAATQPPAAAFKACQVTDTGGIDDKSFNATAWKGVQDAIDQLGVEGKYLESQQQTDYDKNINAFIDEGCNIIITVGFLLGDATKAAAEKNPNQLFSIVDFAYDPPIPNVLGQVFNTNEAGFLAGYVAAGVSKTGKVGTFGGIQIPTVTVFMDGFALGVQHYNEKHGTNVEVLGWDANTQTGLFTGNFESTDDGRTMGETLMDEGADIIMPVAGPVGLGTAAAAKERGNVYIIGVDNDWYVTAPDYKDIILTSVMKYMDVTTFNAIKAAMEGTFQGGVTVGTLENGGVGLAPFHDLDSMVPAELKSELESLKADIIAGKIATSPGEMPKPEATEPPAMAAPTGQLEIFSWWTAGGEADGLNAMYEVFKKMYPEVEIINATVAGGAGQNAKAVLATRMQAGDPPDSFQVHAGHELIDSWVKADKMEPVTFIFEQNGWMDKYPQGVIDILSYNGEIWSVPVNIHRSNVLWYNKAVFDENGLTAPTTWDEFFTIADTLKAKGITPLALGDNGIWATTHLFESILLATLGPDGYKGLWDGSTAWDGDGVKQALEILSRLLTDYINEDHAALSWDQAAQLVADGDAAMTIMGDWVAGYYTSINLEPNVGYGYAPSPGTSGNFIMLSDSFGLPKGAPNRDAAVAWLTLCGSKEGQDAFNPLKGSIPARTDGDRSLYNAYLQSAMDDFGSNTIVPSVAHGAAASEGWVTAINDVMTLFVADLNVDAALQAFVQACTDAGVCK
jgi:glucose/mannose transport system substrate-binding protein